MIPNNIYNLSELLISIGEIDSRLIRENSGRRKITTSELFAQRNSESKVVNYRNDERIFLDNVINSVQQRITDSSFNLNQFATDMKISRSTLHRKINLLTGLTLGKFVHSYRIQIAQQLLLNKSLNISEVAYQIGFNDPRYFSRCFRNEVGISPKEYRGFLKQKSINTQSTDQQFLEKALIKLEMNISDANLSFDQFANEMNVSKASLYRKLKSVAGLSPCQFIRSVRIKHSAQLLAKNNNISEVAFAVGFNDSKYFSRCFKREFGVAPKKYQELFDS
ncbi:MAG: AraC family transcriptional regulator [Paludibacter sp.]|nr:AraC family transcriptional regulator [Paludibacter sp.]